MKPRRSDPPSGLVVELCGLPGAGKSSLAVLARGTLRGHGVAVPDPGGGVGPEVAPMTRSARKGALVAGAALRGPGSALRSARGLMDSGQPSSSGTLHRWVQWMVAEERLTRARRSRRTWLLDEGIVQALWSVGLHGDVSPMLETLGRAGREGARPDLIVALEVPPELAAHRLRVRGSTHSRVQSLPSGTLEASLRDGHELLGTILARCSDLWGEGSIARLDGEGAPPVDGLVRLIEDRLSSAVSTRG